LDNNFVGFKVPYVAAGSKPAKGIIVIRDILYFDIRAFKQILLACPVNKISWDDGRELLRPGNDMNFCAKFVECFRQRSIEIGNATFELRTGAKANDFQENTELRIKKTQLSFKKSVGKHKKRGLRFQNFAKKEAADLQIIF